MFKNKQRPGDKIIFHGLGLPAIQIAEARFGGNPDSQVRNKKSFGQTGLEKTAQLLNSIRNHLNGAHAMELRDR